MRQITDNVYVFPFMAGFINVYLIETHDGLLLSDTGTSPAQMDRVLNDLQKSGRKAEDIKHIFITHAHNDHIGGLNHLQKILPLTTRTYAHRREAAIIRGEAPMIFPPKEELGWLMGAMRSRMPTHVNVPARVDSEVKEGDKIAGLLEVVELPGHAYGQCGLWWKERGILFGGDVMVRFLWGLARPFRVASPDQKAVIASIKKVAAMNLKMLCVCHGATLTQNTAATIQTFADRFSLDSN
jgi:glyoxylase-like metal-dependent hydrolase (beta-lactamase superfamily II)